jgi:hypothetical protein
VGAALIDAASPEKTVTTSGHDDSYALVSIGDLNGDGIDDFAVISNVLTTDVFYGSGGLSRADRQ